MARLDYNPIPLHPVSGVTPFTYQDGVTYLAILQNLTKLVQEHIVPLLNSVDAGLRDRIEQINANFDALIEQFTGELDKLDPDKVRVLVENFQSVVFDLQVIVADIAAFWTHDEETGYADGIPVGKTVYADAINHTQTSIVKGAFVSFRDIPDAATTLPSVQPFDGSLPVFGVTMGDIAPGQRGRVARFGYVEGVDTSGLRDGQVAYLSATGIVSVTTNTRIGVVTRVGVNGGILLLVEPNFGPDIANLKSYVDTQDASVRTYSDNANNTLQTRVDGQFATRDATISGIQSALPRDYERKFMFNMQIEGADITGAAACDAIFNRGVLAIRARGGGTIYFPAGIYRFANRASLQPETSTKAFPPIELVGDGPNEATTDGRDSWRTGGTILTFDAGGLFLDTWGKCVVRDLSLQNRNSPNSTSPLMQIVSTTTLVHNVAFRGHPTKSGIGAIQTGIMMGSPNGDPLGIFQGYGTHISNVNFDNLAELISMLRGTNGVVVENVIVANQCGHGSVNGAAFRLDRSGDQVAANTFRNIVGEVFNYGYMFNLYGAEDNYFENIQAWDVMGSQRFKHVFQMHAAAASARNVMSKIFVDGSDRNSDNLVNSIGAGKGMDGNTGNNTYVHSFVSTAPGVGGTPFWGDFQFQGRMWVPPIFSASNANPPPMAGMLGYAATSGELLYYDGTSWKKVTVSPL